MTPVQEQQTQLEPLSKNEKLRFLFEASLENLKGFIQLNQMDFVKDSSIPSEDAFTANNISSTKQVETFFTSGKYSKNDIKSQMLDILEIVEGKRFNEQLNASDWLKTDYSTNKVSKKTLHKTVVSPQASKGRRLRSNTASKEENKNISLKNKAHSPTRSNKDSPSSRARTTLSSEVGSKKMIPRARIKSACDSGAMLTWSRNTRFKFQGQLFSGSTQKNSDQREQRTSIKMQNALYEASADTAPVQAINVGNKQQNDSKNQKHVKQKESSLNKSSIEETSLSEAATPGKMNYKSESFFTKLIQKNSKIK